ncbi:MAG: hypothetical protein ABFS08_00410 [Pseudomonadota bacterium]
MLKNQWLVRLYYLMVLSALVASLFILWHVRFPPMQDYPAHLMVANIVSTAKDATYDWHEYYHIEPKIGPYSASYYLIHLFQKFLDIEDAGKAALSLYFMLIAMFVVYYSRIQIRQNHLPWLMLLIFPLSYNQVYYFGFLNYLISIPILLWLIIDYQRIGLASRNKVCTGLQLVAPLLLFLLHPFTLLLYCGLSLSSLAFRKIKKKNFVKEHWIPLLWTVLFIVWFVAANIGGERGATAFPDLYYYWSIQRILSFLVLPISGHHTFPVSLYVMPAWAILGYVLLRSEQHTKPMVSYKYLLILLFLAYMLLPFNFLGYSYFSSRLVAPLYMFLAVYLSYKVIEARYLAVIMIFMVVVYYDIYKTHQSVSGEIERQLIPLIEKIPRNSRVLPLYRNGGSEYLDQHIYPQAFFHTHNYYHVLVGGGVSLGLVYNDMLPVRYNDNTIKMATNGVVWTKMELQRASKKYDYMLIRSRLSVADAIPSSWKALSTTGEWMLYQSLTVNSLDY